MIEPHPRRKNGRAAHRTTGVAKIISAMIERRSPIHSRISKLTMGPIVKTRRGTAHIIKRYKPVVVPIVIDGFRRSFDKKGLRIKKKNILQSFEIKAPLEIDYENETTDEIVKRIEYAIEQHPSFLKVIPQKELEALEELNKKREW